MVGFNEALNMRKSLRCFRAFNTPREMLSSVTSDFEGRMVKSSKYVVDNPLTRFQGLKPSDFALENTLELGVSMSFCKCSLNAFAKEQSIISSLEKLSKVKNDGNKES